jgi:hypothetical protein
MFMAADVELLLLLEVLLTESFEHQWAFMRIASTPLPDLPEAANAVPCPSRELAAIVFSACELKEDGYLIPNVIVLESAGGRGCPALVCF